MEHNTDFSKITRCGDCCEKCGLFYDNGCKGCHETQGKENKCVIFKCCEEHGAYFCGICWEFPCGLLKSKISEWDKNGIYNLTQLAKEYRRQQHENRHNKSIS